MKEKPGKGSSRKIPLTELLVEGPIHTPQQGVGSLLRSEGTPAWGSLENELDLVCQLENTVLGG